MTRMTAESFDTRAFRNQLAANDLNADIFGMNFRPNGLIFDIAGRAGRLLTSDELTHDVTCDVDRNGKADAAGGA